MTHTRLGQSMGKLRSVWMTGGLLASGLGLGGMSVATVAQELPAAYVEADAARLQAIQRAASATLCIFSSTDDAGGGSGVVVTPDGYAVTNYHVTAPSGDYLRCGMADGKLYDAVIVGIDPTGDVAVIKLFGRDDFPTAPWGNSDRVRVGDSCFAVGNPFALATDFQPSVTAGIISGVHRYQEPSGTLIEYTDCLQTDASVNPGNSGGPLFNALGEVLGINGRCSFEKRGRVNVGVAYAISINQIRHFWGHLRSGRIVDHATAGFTVSTRGENEAVVTNILRDSDAYRRGVRDGDVVLALHGRSVDSANTFKNILGTLPQGWRVPLTLLRHGEILDILVRLDGVHAREELLQLVQPGGLELEPTPDRRPPDGEPSPDDDGDRPPQRRRPRSATPDSDVDAPPMPPQVKEHYEKRRGYANYFFNRLQRDEILERARDYHQVRTGAATWRMSIQSSRRGAAELELGELDAKAEFVNGRVEDFTVTQLSQPQARGGSPNEVLPALYLWKRLLCDAQERFGDIYYLGQSPLHGLDGLFDVLVGTVESVEAHFYFRPTTGELIVVELFPDLDVDPTELWFEEPLAGALGNLPRIVRVKCGDAAEEVLEVRTTGTKAELETSS